VRMSEVPGASPEAAATAEEALVIDIEGFEGPLDLLLSLARSQKVDLRRISVLALAEQYLAFIEGSRRLRIELAADYLVMAAWLAFLKSRLLLPPDPSDDGPAPEDLARHLAFQLERLAAMREAAAALMARDQLGRDVFARGLPEDVARIRTLRHTASLIDLIQAYARLRTRDAFRPYAFDRRDVYTMEAALERLRLFVGSDMGWTELSAFLPPEWTGDPVRRRSATAAHFSAVLELARQGRITIRQREVFAPVELHPARASS
jgi:segregation and condensation protein A